MKRTDLEKSLGKKINNRIGQKGGSDPFSRDADKTIDKREQRKIDQAKGLVPFAVKLNKDLVQRIQNIAQKKQTSINDVVAELLQNALDSMD